MDQFQQQDIEEANIEDLETYRL